MRGKMVSVSLPLESGHATHRYGNDGTYTGQWKNRLPHGQGELTWDDGSFYDGSFRDGKMAGQGKLVFDNGHVYEGSWLNGKMDGQGKIDTETFVSKGLGVMAVWKAKAR
jgi:hypothetical protein